MHFCVKCDNMYYLKLNEEDMNKLIYYCRHCGHEDDTITKESICVIKSQVKKGNQIFDNIINEYTREDKTLPRTRSIKCPNKECDSNKDEEGGVENEIIYMRYDDANMRFVYICSNCNYVWKTNNQ